MKREYLLAVSAVLLSSMDVINSEQKNKRINSKEVFTENGGRL